MSSDQWDATERVRVRYTFGDGTEESSKSMLRADAERMLAAHSWLAAPIIHGKPVRSASIKRVLE